MKKSSTVVCRAARFLALATGNLGLFWVWTIQVILSHCWAAQNIEVALQNFLKVEESRCDVAFLSSFHLSPLTSVADMREVSSTVTTLMD
jgi:hypothetical protein